METLTNVESTSTPENSKAETQEARIGDHKIDPKALDKVLDAPQDVPRPESREVIPLHGDGDDVEDIVEQSLPQPTVESTEDLKEGRKSPAAKPPKPTQKLFDAEWWSSEAQAQRKKAVVVQDPTEGPKALKEGMSKAARDETDYYSTHDVEPQPDGGKGVRALAAAHAERVQTLAKAGKLPKEQTVTACAVATETGQDMATFLDALQAHDKAHGTDTYNQTKPFVTCTSAKRMAAIQESGILKSHRLTCWCRPHRKARKTRGYLNS